MGNLVGCRYNAFMKVVIPLDELDESQKNIKDVTSYAYTPQTE